MEIVADTEDFVFLTAESLDRISLSRYEIALRSQTDTVLPPFLGSTLRGAFGHALKAIACSMPHGDCQSCFLVERCLYPRLFETTARRASKSNGHSTLLNNRQDAPRPFIFIPPLPTSDSGFLPGRDDLIRRRVTVKANESIVFGLSLIGNTVDELPYVIYAISLMSQHGFGAARDSFLLERVRALDPQGVSRAVFQNGMDRLTEHSDCLTSLGRMVEVRLAQLGLERVPAYASPDPAPKVTLRFLTPTRMRIKGQVVETPSFEQIITSLSLRLSMLAEAFATMPLVYDYKSMIDRAREVKTVRSSLRLMALDRFSNRREAKLQLDGFVGDITFAGPSINRLLPLLVAGEFLNLGSGTAFGLGRYMIFSN